MDEAMLKSGQFPNVAIMAGSDPTEVMREYANDDSHDALKEQINRFNASKSEEIAENGTSKGDINNFDVQNDTREKLEADIRAWHRDTPFATKPSVQTLLGWLDRQAAITRVEVDEMRDCADCSEGMLANMQQQVDELTAERDRLQAKVDELNASWRKANDGWAEANAEAERWRQKRDQLSRDLDAEHALVVQFEHDNEELKADLKTANCRKAGFKMREYHWNPLRYGETYRICVDCQKPFIPAARIQKYCPQCKPLHKGCKHYGGKAGYKAFRAAKP